MSIRKSIAWLGSGQVASLVLQFGSSIVLARFLSPKEMGIYAVAVAVAATLSIFQNFGLQALIVREEVMTDALKHTTFSVNCLSSLALSAAIALASVVLAHSFEEPGIRDVLLILAVCPILSIPSFLPSAMFEREGRFGTIAAINAGSSIVQAAVTIVLVVLGHKYMSMAYGTVVSTVATSAMFLLWGREHRSARWTLSSWRRVSAFGLQIFLVTSTTSLSQRLSDILLGRLAGLGSLGLYNRAVSLGNIVWINIHGLMSRIVLTDMANLRRAEVPLRERYLQTVSMTLALLWPAFAGMAVVARPFVVAIYGERWERAAGLLSYVCIASMILVTITMVWEVFAVSNNLRIQTRVEAVRLVVSIALLAAGALISVEAAAASRIPEAIVACFLYRPHLNRITDTRFRDLRSAYWQGGVLTIGAILPAAVLMLTTTRAQQTPLLLGIVVVAGVGLWVAMLFRLGHPLATEIGKIAAAASTRLRSPRRRLTRADGG
ncbi:MAG: oligosaccharide flippase family protein [Janthinobacterium lividum]